MARRTFAFQKRLAQIAGGSVLDIPHTAILRYASPQELLSLFREQWGVPPGAVVLPVTNPDGLLFPVDGLSEALSPYATGMGTSIRDFSDAVQRFADLGLDIYLLVDPTLPFLNSDPLHLIDITGSPSRQLCLGNSRTQDIVAGLLGTAVDLSLEVTKRTKGKLKGVVLDVVDLWPMGGDDDRIKATCFCPSCESFMDNMNPGLVRRFKTFPNPWNLVLQASSTGIDHINEIRRDDGAEELVGLSKLKGFHTAYEDQSMPFLLEQGKGALDYIEARHAQTLFAAKAIFDQALDDIEIQPQRILLVEGMYYSWTGGFQLEKLDSIETLGAESAVYDEVWFDVRSSSLALERVAFRAYMSSRSRYYIDAFFHLAAQASNAEARASTGIGRYSASRLKDMLRERLAKVMACLVTGQTSLGALQDLKSPDTASQRVGFVGVGLTKEIGEKFIEGLRIAPGLAAEGPAGGSSDIEALMRMVLAQRAQREKGEDEQ